jgi:protein-disulfide isomerase
MSFFSTTTLALLAISLALPVSAQHTATAPLARVNGRVITEADVNGEGGVPLAKLEEQLYAVRRQYLDKLIANQLLADEAERRGVSVQALVAAEVTSKVATVTEPEVDEFLKSNSGRLQGDPVAVRQQIRTYLRDQRVAGKREAFVQSLRARADVVLLVKKPAEFRAKLNTDGAPFRGSATALVTIVEFSDFHCPFCRQVGPVVAQVLSRYGDKVKLVHRDFPLDSLHPQARQAAEAARCAGDQGKFWQYHDRLLVRASNGSTAELRATASAVGLDMVAFDRCASSRTYREAVQHDVDEGTRLGVTGTPTFFINGRSIAGTQPIDAFASLIDQELAHR